MREAPDIAMEAEGSMRVRNALASRVLRAFAALLFALFAILPDPVIATTANHNGAPTQISISIDGDGDGDAVTHLLATLTAESREPLEAGRDGAHELAGAEPPELDLAGAFEARGPPAR